MQPIRHGRLTDEMKQALLAYRGKHPATPYRLIAAEFGLAKSTVYWALNANKKCFRDARDRARRKAATGERKRTNAFQSEQDFLACVRTVDALIDKHLGICTNPKERTGAAVSIIDRIASLVEKRLVLWVDTHDAELLGQADEACFVAPAENV